MPTVYLSPSTQEYNRYYDNSGSEEYYMNLIADAMEPYLDASGIRWSRNDPDESLSQAISDSNAARHDLHLALHSNASPVSLEGMLKGSDFYYYETSTRGKEAANVLADRFRRIYPDPSLVRTVPSFTLAELRRTIAPSVLVEIAYHDNPEDAEWIKNNIDEIAENLVQGLCAYFGIPFSAPQNKDDIFPRGIVNTDGGRLNIRSRPSTEAAVIGQIPNGEWVLIFGRVGDWYVVEYQDVLGFSKDEYILQKQTRDAI